MNMNIESNILFEKILKFPQSETFFVQKGHTNSNNIWATLFRNGYSTDFSIAKEFSRDEILEMCDEICSQSMTVWISEHVKEKISKTVGIYALNDQFKIT